MVLKSSQLIDKETNQKLIESIKSSQDKLYNYRNEQFIRDDAISNTPFTMRNKPKSQELIPKFQYFRDYKQLKQSTLNVPKELDNYRYLMINLSCAIFVTNKKISYGD